MKTAGSRLYAALAVALLGLAALKALGLSAAAAPLLGGTPAYAASGQDKSAAKSAKPASPKADAHAPEKADKAEDGPAAEPAPKPAPAPACPPPTLADRAGLSHAEIGVLQSLAERREAIEARAAEADLAAKLAAAAEAKVEARINALKALKGEVEDLLGQLDAAEEAQMAGLVGMYEKMKSKDAARILSGLDKDILIEVAARMKPQALAAILADMPDAEAVKLTVMLAQRHARPPEVDARIAAAVAPGG